MSPTRIGTTRTSKTGAYKFGSLPAGDYFAIAVTDEQATLWLEPQFFPAASRVALRVHIQSGQSATAGLARGRSLAGEPMTRALVASVVIVAAAAAITAQQRDAATQPPPVALRRPPR
jgi:hypothetical protein